MQTLPMDVWTVLISERVGTIIKRQYFLVEGIDASFAIHTAKIQARSQGFMKPKSMRCMRVPNG